MKFAWIEDESEKVVREVMFCGYAGYKSEIAACDAPLPRAVSKTETGVLEHIRNKFAGKVTPLVSRSLLFGDVVKGFTVGKRVALIKLVRRGMVKVAKVPGQGDRQRFGHYWEIDVGGESACGMGAQDEIDVEHAA
jgi:hypothetical protein